MMDQRSIVMSSANSLTLKYHATKEEVEERIGLILSEEMKSRSITLPELHEFLKVDLQVRGQLTLELFVYAAIGRNPRPATDLE